MKVVFALLALVCCTLAFPQHTAIVAPDFRQLYFQDQSGQLSNSFSTRDISRSDLIELIPNGQGDYVPHQRTSYTFVAPNGERVTGSVDAGLQGAIHDGSHIPRA